MESTSYVFCCIMYISLLLCFQVQGYSIGFDVSHDGQTVYSASSDGKLYCYYNPTGRLNRAIQTGLDVTLDVACHPVLQSTIAVSAWDGTIQVWK
mgnify:CR=1 FL=1